VRVSSDIRLIVHKTAASLLLCYVDHHDKAYRWAECRKLETHPKTGAAQLVEIRERVEEIAVPRYIEVEQPPPMRPTAAKPILFAQVPEDELLGYGVPLEWLPDVRAANEDTLLDLADHLPAEAAEALLELATGGKPQRVALAKVANPFDHPDAQRRFRTLANVEELERALAYPWEKWTIFLHPAQRNGWNATTTGRHAYPALPAPARPSWRCIVRFTWRVPIRKRGSCSRHSPTRWPKHCTRNSDA
jgi:hypothetical protein